MAEWFKASNYFAPVIKTVDVEKSTEKSVWVLGRRMAREAAGEVYMPEWEQARQWLLAEAENQVNIARRSLERANGALGNIKGMKKP